MQLINMRCTSCGAELEVDPEKKQLFCSYCGSKLLLKDENIHITNRFVDEARLKEAEVRLKELEYAHEREIREETLRQEQKKTYRISLIAILCILAVVWIIPGIRKFFPLALVFGLIALSFLRTSDRRSMTQRRSYNYSPKSRLTALLLCVFLGELGIHYFYVGRVFMGLLYMFTLGFFGIGWIIDVIRIACGTFRDSHGLYLME